MSGLLPGAPGGVLVSDGAMGTMLHAAGHPLEGHLPSLNLSDPGVVRAIHDSYLHSGVDMIQANTFGASRLRLEEAGLAGASEQINRAGVQIARQAAWASGRAVVVAGSVSPAVTVHQRALVSGRDRAAALEEQIETLVSAGVDLLVLETFGYLDELVEAVDAASGCGVPVVAEATFTEELRTFSGHTAADVASAVPPRLVTALGTNCTLGPQGCLAVVRELSRHSAVPLTAAPNAGLPRRVGPSRFEYAIDSDYLVRYVRQLIDAGVTVVGGCCGTTPPQIGSVVEIVRQNDEAPGSHVSARAAPRPSTLDHTGAREPERRSFSVAVELLPSARGETETLLRAAETLHEVGVDTVVVGTPLTRENTLTLAVHLGDRIGVDPVVAVSACDRTIMTLQADLLGASVLGVRRIVCETGSPAPQGDYPTADGVWEVDTLGLVDLLNGLNRGRDHHGAALMAPTAFEIGVGVDLGRDDLDGALDDARAAIEAGAGFVVTEPIHELDALDRLVGVVGDRVPVWARLRPVTTFDEADYLRHEVPDVRFPETTLRELERAGPHARAVGRRIAIELAAGVAERAHGLVVCGADATDVGFVEHLTSVCRRAAPPA